MVVIINADDLGISPQVNREILRLVSQGAITSATLLANGAAVEQAATEVRKFPQASFGVHLNLTEFQPVAPSAELQPIIDDAGRFRGNHIREIRLDRELKTGIFQEWCAQIEKLMGLGITPSHIDSHHHTHTIPALFPVLRRVANKYGITKVRISRNLYVETDPLMLRLKKSLYNGVLRHFGGFRTTDLFSGFDTFLERNGGSRHGKSIELMVHPGAPGNENESRRLVEWVRSRPEIRLISYNDL